MVPGLRPGAVRRPAPWCPAGGRAPSGARHRAPGRRPGAVRRPAPRCPAGGRAPPGASDGKTKAEGRPEAGRSPAGGRPGSSRMAI
ncbi:hypothetical protein AB1Y20_020198 [Prymnesium parvum]|uniref:Uncharacterized protein n=1 Tax=Prymnesium parvum TaxID=97485 RepID=A0AB34JLV8_PRYPA